MSNTIIQSIPYTVFTKTWIANLFVNFETCLLRLTYWLLIHYGTVYKYLLFMQKLLISTFYVLHELVLLSCFGQKKSETLRMHLLFSILSLESSKIK